MKRSLKRRRGQKFWEEKDAAMEMYLTCWDDEEISSRCLVESSRESQPEAKVEELERPAKEEEELNSGRACVSTW